MDFKSYPMPFNERIQYITPLQHWKMFLTLDILSIIACIIFIIITYKLSYYMTGWHFITMIISGIAFISALVITIMLIPAYYSAQSNNHDMHYISYKGNGEVVKSSDNKSKDHRIITFNSGIEQYELTIDKKYNVSKGDLIKISSNGKIPTIDYSENIKRNLTYNAIKSDHKLDVKIKHNDKWYDIDVNTIGRWW